MHSDFHSRIEYKPLQGLEVKASLEIRLDSHQFINSLLHVIWVTPIEDQHAGRQNPLVLRVKRYQRLVSWQPTPDT